MTMGSETTCMDVGMYAGHAYMYLPGTLYAVSCAEIISADQLFSCIVYGNYELTG